MGRDASREFTIKAVVCGLVFGALFGAANAYLGLKVGLTVSTSIPIAVLSAAAFRLMGGGSILEANLSQTIGSASSSLAAGTIFTIPALFMGHRAGLRADRAARRLRRRARHSRWCRCAGC
jgi:putative OPT family oligopeptide transporter